MDGGNGKLYLKDDVVDTLKFVVGGEKEGGKESLKEDKKGVICGS